MVRRAFFTGGRPFNLPGALRKTMNPSIVIVDDDPNALFGISQILRDEGYEVFSFNNAPGALQFYKNNTVDLIITDEKMPEMSGMEVLTEI